MKRFYWVGYCQEERIRTTSQVASVINTYGALISTNFFSDVATSFVIEVPANEISSLYQALKQHIQIEDVDLIPTTATYECTILLNLSFRQGTGNLTINVPQVPG